MTADNGQQTGIEVEAGITADGLPVVITGGGRGEYGKFGAGNQAAKGHGRPLSDKSLMAQLRQLDTPGNAAKIARAVFKRAMNGESWAVEFVFNRLYGRVPQETRIGGAMGEDGHERPIPLLLLPSLPVLEVDNEAAETRALPSAPTGD